METLRTNAAGIAIVKKWEGFRSSAYLCPAGVWTIGYGHTSAAGLPKVKQGMKISKQEGEKILRDDLRVFEVGVAKALKKDISQNAFSACVSLAFNIGVGAFTKSSVVKAINAGNNPLAAKRFLLWNKANGKVLPGLVARRAEEAELFLRPDKRIVQSDVEVEIESQEGRLTPDAPRGKPMVKSTTSLAAVSAGAAGSVGLVSEIANSAASAASGVRTTREIIGDALPWVLLVVLLVAVAWIVWERWLKSRDDGV